MVTTVASKENSQKKHNDLKSPKRQTPPNLWGRFFHNYAFFKLCTTWWVVQEVTRSDATHWGFSLQCNGHLYSQLFQGAKAPARVQLHLHVLGEVKKQTSKDSLGELVPALSQPAHKKGYQGKRTTTIQIHIIYYLFIVMTCDEKSS